MAKFVSREMKHVSRVSGVEAVAVAALTIVSLVTQLLLLPSDFKGADTRTFLRISVEMMERRFWSDPEAFNGNYWSVGYPMFLAAVRTLFNESIVPVQVAQVFMAASLIPLTWLLCQAQRPSVRLTSAAVAASSPSVFFLGSNGGYEILLAWLMVTSLAIAWGLGGRPAGPRWWRWLGAGATAGVVLGAGSIVQNKAIVIVPVVVFLFLRWGRAPVGFFLLGLVLPIGVWSVRNLVVRGSPSPFTTNGPINMWIGSNPDVTTGGFMEPPPLPPDSASFLDATLKFWISQPEVSVAQLLRRLARLLEPVYIYAEVPLPSGGSLILHVFSFAMTVVLLMMMWAYLFGRLWATPPLLPEVGPLAVAWLVFLIAHLPFLAEPRFRTPMEPVLIAVAVPTAFALSERWSRSRRARPTRSR